MKSLRSNQGYALATVFTFSVLLALTAVVLLKYSGSEFRLNQRNQLRFQAKNAAEAMLEYGASEIMMRLQKNLNFSTGELTGNPLTAQNRKTTLYTTGTGTYNNVSASNLSFWASQYTEPTTRYIDPSDPGNAYDPLRGQFARCQTIRFLASATASSPALNATQYATQAIEIRDVSLFNYAIFYNIAMEFHPGAAMTVNGPVHSNVDAHMTTDATLKFLQSFTTAGKFTADALATGRSSNPNIFFTNGLDQNLDSTPDTIAINDSSIRTASGASLGTSYVDSNLASRSTGNTFAQIASQTWRGNVQDSSMGIVAQNLPAVSAGDSTTAHTLVEPPDTSSSANATLEAQKYSNKAGLYVFVAANSGGTPPAPVAFKSATDANTYRALSTSARATWLTNSANRDKVVMLPSSVINTNRRMKDFRENSVVSMVDVDVGALRTAVNSTTAGSSSNIKAWNSSTGSYSSDLDLDSSTTRNGSADTMWNGTVYVEVENPSAGYTATGSEVSGSPTAAATRTAVRLINGSQVPNRSQAVSSAPDGFTVATNAPIYVAGNYNSPGPGAGTRSGTAVAATESATSVSLPKDGESPAAIIADAINILSNAWMSGTTPTGDGTSTSSTAPNATSTEISAAFLTGNVATTSGGASYSGGVENFPRFHENWGSAKIRYRGSMVALFNSTVATGPWSSARYSAPTREWGFNQMFQSGRQPPGTPRIRSFRRIGYGDLTAAQFNALLTNTSLAFTSM